MKRSVGRSWMLVVAMFASLSPNLALPDDVDPNDNASPTSLAIAGHGNVVSGVCAVVVGGASNAAGVVSSVFPDYSGYDAVLGGCFNVAGGGGSVVLGGWGNCATGFASVISGGLGNIAGEYGTFAAGEYAWAMHRGSFVWADPLATPFFSTANNQFLVRASGGVGINTKRPAMLHRI